MNIDNLVRMANQIGTFFASYPDQEAGRTGIADHLQRYWAPRMRQQLYAHIDVAQGDGLAPMVLEAIIEHRRETAPVAAQAKVFARSVKCAGGDV
jgi:formate dehydrogenase subunit delta